MLSDVHQHRANDVHPCAAAGTMSRVIVRLDMCLYLELDCSAMLEE